MARSKVDLDELIKIMIDLYGPSMSEKGLQILLKSSAPSTIEADESLIHRMIANLFDNEFKHLPPNCTVTIRLKVEGESVSLVFEDDGPGFSDEVIPHLFERRVKGRESNGHGLGLAFIDAVARAHGATVTACNRESGGAQIEVTLPIAASNYKALPIAVLHGAG